MLPSSSFHSGQPTNLCLTQEVLDTGIVEAHQTVDDILIECYARFHHAKATVLANKPEAYTTPSEPGRDKTFICPEPAVHVSSGHS